MGREWECLCKDCNKPFSYSDTKYKAGLILGHSRPERCDNCRAQHGRENQSFAQPYYVLKALKPIGDPRRLTSDLGRFDREDRPHEAVETIPPAIDPNKFGIKDDRLVEMFHFFKQDPGLQVVVVVGPTGSGKSTYLPYRLVEPPTNYQDKAGSLLDTYWTVPIETNDDLNAAEEELKKTKNHTIWVKGHDRHYTNLPDDARAVAHKVAGTEGLDPQMFWRHGQIVITQPRIQATRNLPDFIAKAMMGCQLGAGHDIGFRHSGSPNSDWSTKLAFVTDGTLITWIAKGELDKINTIMIDEAHERTFNIDIIIGMLTQVLPRYPRLRLIIASATIAADKFINHFNKHLPERKDKNGNILPNCRFIEFEGKSFKVIPHFRRADETPLDYYREQFPPGLDGKPRWEGRHRQPGDLFKQVAEKAVEILKAMYDTSPDGGYLTDHEGNKIDITERRGDVLGFLHGEKPIEDCCALVVEQLSNQELGEGVKIKALPLYTTLPQDRQDYALKEREQPHDYLLNQIVRHLAEVANGKKPPTDVLAILNNAGQIHNLCADLDKYYASPAIILKKKAGEKVVEEEFANPVFTQKVRVVFIPWFTPATAKQLFETMPERWDLKMPPAEAGTIRVVISTSRHRGALLEKFPTVLNIPPQEQRVVVSTNVAETSLTIHGILHVVDSGLINQNKWDAATQTSGVSPILQSRAGCKQRWGRAGRLQAGDSWLLYTAEQFGEDDQVMKEERRYNDEARTFVFYSLPEISRIPLEQALLTAKKAGVESLDPANFPWLDAPDSDELARSVRSLKQKGALDPEGDLTAHGVELGSMIGVDTRVGNMLVVADRFACAVEMATVIAVAAAERKGLKALLEHDKPWDDQTLREVRQRQGVVFAGCRDDLDAALRLVACWEEVSAAGAAFVNYVRWSESGDALTREHDLAQEHDHPAQHLISQLWNTTDELVTDRLVQELVRQLPEPRKKHIPDLRKAAESSLAFRRAYERLAGAWQAIAHEWSFAKVWDEAVATPVAASQFLHENASAARREKVTDTLIDFFARYRAAVARGGNEPQRCLSQLFDQMASKQNDPQPSDDLVTLLAGMADPVFVTDVDSLVRSLRRISDPGRHAIEKALVLLPEAAAKAWARANYLKPDAIAGVISSRAELLASFEAHKKGTESRPLDLTRNDRLRALFAHSLPDNAYRRQADGKYTPAATGIPADQLDVEPAADSVCAANAPELFVCVERRAGPVVPGKARKLFASFIVALPTDWAQLLSNAKQPFHKFSAARLGRFVAESCKREPQTGKDLLVEAVYPKTALCKVRVMRQHADGTYEVMVKPPHVRPLPVMFRPKLVDEGDTIEAETEEAIRSPSDVPPDLGLSKELRNLRAGSSKEESEEGQVSSSQWEDLFRQSHAAQEDVATAGAIIAVADQAVRPVVETGGIAAILHVERALQPGQGELVAEVTYIDTATDRTRRPHLRYPSSSEQLRSLTKALKPNDIGQDRTMVVEQLEQLPLDAGWVLVARDEKSGAEVTFGAKDLSFSWCGVVSKMVFEALPKGNKFNARIVQVDAESGRVRMTTHHLFEELMVDANRFIGKQKVEVIQNTYVGTFVQLFQTKDWAKHGFMLVAKLAEGQLQNEQVGSRHEVHTSFPNKTKEAWPIDVQPLNTLLADERTPDEVAYKGRVTLAQLAAWQQESGDRRDVRAGLYSLYERTNQLNGMDEARYAHCSKSIGRRMSGRVTDNPSGRAGAPGPGLQLALTDPSFYGITAWMPREEYTWYCDEDHSQCRVGDVLEMKGREIDLAGNQIVFSRRWLDADTNPYSRVSVGQTVKCEVIREESEGSELSISRLRGWAFANRLVWLPGETSRQMFDASVTMVDPDRGKIRVSRWPLVQLRLRKSAEGVVLNGRIIGIENNEAKVELAPDIVATLWAGEVTWEQGSNEGERLLPTLGDVEVVIVPPRANDREERIRVSRKQAWVAEYHVSGAMWKLLGGTGSPNRKAAIAAAQRYGAAAYFTSRKEEPTSWIKICADNRRAFEEVVGQVARHARNAGCILSPKHRVRTGSVWLEDLFAATQPPPPSVQQPIRQRKAASLPPAPVSQKTGLFAKFIAFIRRLVSG